MQYREITPDGGERMKKAKADDTNTWRNVNFGNGLVIFTWDARIRYPIQASSIQTTHLSADRPWRAVCYGGSRVQQTIDKNTNNC